MAFTYETVTISAVVYDVYVIVADADDYLSASLYATDWSGATADDQARALVMATRLLDRQNWDGSKTDSDNDHPFPRTGLTDENGDAIDSATIPQFIKDATAELADALIATQDVETFGDTAEVSRVAAGSASVDFYRGTPGATKRFPTVVQELVGDYLAGSNSSGMIPFVDGTDEVIVDVNSDLSGGYA
jgi:hypothetical protein